jgi:type VI secretion system secreted protein Hcp
VAIPARARTGMVCLEELVVVKDTDSASALFRDAAAAGTTFGEAVLSCRKAGGEQQEYMTVTLEDVLVSSYQASSDETPTESISFTFSRIEWEG